MASIRPTYAPVSVGVVGLGYWGPRLARNFNSAETTRLVALCDRDPKSRQSLVKQHPGVPIFDSLDAMLALDELEAVAIATPVAAHHELAKKALSAGKHVLVEKPFTRSAGEARELLDLAQQRDLIVAVDHTYLYTPAARRLRKVVQSGKLGELLYFDSIRINLGLFQPDVDVIWDLAPHDFSLIDYVMPARAQAVSAIARAHTPTGHSDIAYITLDFGSGLLAHLHLNWLAPMKVRQVLIGGSKMMVQWDDNNPNEKIRLYDRGIDLGAIDETTVSADDPDGLYQNMISYRSGDILSPWLARTEALYSECTEFGHAIRTGAALDSDGALGLRVVLMLEAASRSLANQGRFEPIDWPS